MNEGLTETISRFNRFYSNFVNEIENAACLDEVSFSEGRILEEIQQKGRCTAKELVDRLDLDAGYLSRILKEFDKRRLVNKMQSALDGRMHYISLTDKGREIAYKRCAMKLDKIRDKIQNVTAEEARKLMESMRLIESALEGMTNSEIQIRTKLYPGDGGRLIYMQGYVYARECGYNTYFEGYLCRTFEYFLQKYDEEKDGIWIAEDCGDLIGAIAVVAHTKQRAQLRWLMVLPQYRGCGIGKRLFQMAMDFCREKKYTNLFLETNEEQKRAIQLFTRAGFEKVLEKKSDAWGRPILEQTYEINLYDTKKAE